MKKIFYGLFALIIFVNPVVAATIAKTSPTTWKPVAPAGYSPITWAGSPGVATFYKAPAGNGTMDFLTRIYLPQNEINPVVSNQPFINSPIDSNFLPDRQAQIPGAEEVNTISGNILYNRIVAESAKILSPETKFIWDAPFFNMGRDTSDLSLALRYSSGAKSIITSGTRSDVDLFRERRMLLVDNKTGKAEVLVFDAVGFLNEKYDFAVEGFAPTVAKTDVGESTGRLFMGVTPSGKELVVYCSRQASAKEASQALLDAGVPVAKQLQADGGGSTACGYNLPGQYFVEPSRTLPVMLGASTVYARGNITTQDTNVRIGPSTKNKIVTKLAKGAAVTIYEEKTGWYRIGNGQWVIKSLIKTVDIGK